MRPLNLSKECLASGHTCHSFSVFIDTSLDFDSQYDLGATAEQATTKSSLIFRTLNLPKSHNQASTPRENHPKYQQQGHNGKETRKDSYKRKNSYSCKRICGWHIRWWFPKPPPQPFSMPLGILQQSNKMFWAHFQHVFPSMHFQVYIP